MIITIILEFLVVTLKMVNNSYASIYRQPYSHRSGSRVVIPQFSWHKIIKGNKMDRWEGIKRPYTEENVKRLRDRFQVRYTIAEKGAEKLWRLINEEAPVRALGAMSGNQAMQMVKAGLKGIYVSGWQTAADANVSGQMYPDQSLYPVNSVPHLVSRINNCLRRADQIENVEGLSKTDWQCPIVADAEAGFGGPLNAYELMKAMIEAGAAGVHFEDQLASEKKCGHLGGKVLVPTKQFITTLIAARLAADVLEVPTVLIARTDADSAKLITSDVDPYDRDFIEATAGRTEEGFYRLCGSGMERCIARGLAYAPYADMLWMETSHPNLDQAKEFADAIHTKYPGKLLAYNCSPSFNWKSNLDDKALIEFQKELGKMGYKFQFVTLAGFHSLNYNMFNLALSYNAQGMLAYSRLQQDELFMENAGYTATKHQREVGTGFFDTVRNVITGGKASTDAMLESTETEQF
jgi:isocitrate lyase